MGASIGALALTRKRFFPWAIAEDRMSAGLLGYY